MVATTSTYYLDQGMTTPLSPASSATKCRYKTGKCTNQRSSKRNGQPHMLCLYHRDKANKIQRKFDRQKRQSVRMKKTGASAPSSRTNSPRAITTTVSGAASAFAQSIATASTFTGLLTQELDIYSDSESSRISTDSESSRLSTDSESCTVTSLDLVWPDMSFGAATLSPMPTTCASSAALRYQSSMTSGSLSHEEIDFLYSAMLE